MFPRIAIIEHMCESLSLFSEPTKAWFEHAFGQPTEAQAQAWPAIHSGRNVLVIAPTGSGKTLAAFLSAIDRLMTVSRTRRAGVRVLYVSPLKALAVDVAKTSNSRWRVSLRNVRRRGCPRRNRGCQPVRRHHCSGASAHRLPSAGHPCHHARIALFAAHFQGRADSRHRRHGNRR